MSLKSATTILALLAGLFMSTWTLALEKEPFTKERFDKLQEQGSTILVDVSATWCPTCQRQHEILDKYREENPNSGITMLTVDFDNQKEWVKHFKAPRQSTLILYKGTNQVWFSVAETRQEKIFEALDNVKVEEG
ncbi:thioredoxin family protein [Halomonas elongata]|uniref:thioredoxin family protein n=1 Tax=Halomonas elongata TaxID=2746 RepID=UPI0023AF13A2|nr:thioredoxin family protein [Halomonas elongata]